MTIHLAKQSNKARTAYFPGTRRWWRTMAVVLVTAAILRFTGYNFGLPYIDTPDEATFLTGSLYYRGLYNQPFALQGYPPGILWVYQGAQILVELTTGHSALENPAQTIAVVRIAAILTSLLATIFIGLLARRMGGEVAGFLAALIWTVLPQAVFDTSIGMTEAWLVLFCTLAIYCSLIALESDWAGWPLLSIASALTAVIFKYPAYPVLGPVIAVTLWRLRQRDHRSQWLRILALQIIAIVLCAAWLVVTNGAMKLQTINSVQQGFLSRVFNFQLGFSAISQALWQLGVVPWLAATLLIVGTILYFRQVTVTQFVGWALVLLFSFSAAYLVTTYFLPERFELKYQGYYLTLADLGFTVLLAVALTCIGRWVRTRSRQPWVGRIVVGGFVIVWLGPLLATTWNNAQQDTFPDTRAAVGIWSAHALGEGSIIVDRFNQRTFNREWGGYAGPYRVWIEDELTNHPLTYWLNEYVNYAELSDNQLQELKQTNDGKTYLDHMLLLKEFPPEGQRFQWRGPSMHIFRLWRPQHEFAAVFGGKIRLIGYDLTPNQLQPGDMLHLTFYWQADHAPEDNYNVFVHLTALDNANPIAQADGAPLAEDRQTITWTDPTEVLISRDFQVPIPASLTLGCYRLLTGFYNYRTGERLSVGKADSAQLSLLFIGEGCTEF